MFMPHIIFVLMWSFYIAKGIMLCDSGWNRFDDNCYKVVRNMSYAVPYSTSILLCNDEHQNATNVMPKTQEENNYMTTELLINASKIWIGLIDWNMDGNFVWEDGTNLSSSDFNYWAEFLICFILGMPNIAQPDNSDSLGRDENCVGTTLLQSGQWSDVTGLINGGVICQYTIHNYGASTSEIDPTTPTLSEPVTNAHTTTALNLGTTSSVNTFDTAVQNNSTYDCICPCLVSNKSTSYSATTLQEILNNLKVRKELLSSAIRRKNCATDDRKSSSYIGCVGITTLIISFGFIVFLDCSPKRHSSETFNTIRKSFI